MISSQHAFLASLELRLCPTHLPPGSSWFSTDEHLGPGYVAPDVHLGVVCLRGLPPVLTCPGVLGLGFPVELERFCHVRILAFSISGGMGWVGWAQIFFAGLMREMMIKPWYFGGYLGDFGGIWGYTCSYCLYILYSK